MSETTTSSVVICVGSDSDMTVMDACAATQGSTRAGATTNSQRPLALIDSHTS